MLRNEMNNLYALFPSIISTSKCDELIQRGLSLPSQQASIGFDKDHIDNQYRVSTICWFYGPDNKDIVELMMYYATLANRDYFGFDISVGAHEFQFTEYHGNSYGKYDWHHDVWWENTRPHDRKLSVVIQLSDPSSYSGGDFEFGEPCDFDSSAFKPRGSIIVFPSFFRHRVTSVLSGVRYSLVSWIDGPKFR